MKRVAIIYPWFAPLPPELHEGGSDYAHRLALELASCGLAVDVIADSRTGPQSGDAACAAHGVSVHRVVRDWGWSAFLNGEWSKLRRMLSELSPHAICVIYPPARLRARYVTPCFAKLLAPGGRVVTNVFSVIHPHALWRPDNWAATLALYQSSDRLLFMDGDTERLFGRVFPWLRPLTQFVPCGANFAPAKTYSREARDAALRDLGLPADDFYVAFFGYWYPSKHVEIAVRAVAELRRRGMRARLLFVGGFGRVPSPGAEVPKEILAYQGKVWREIEQLGLANSTVSSGHLSEAAALGQLLACDACVFPYGRIEGRSSLLIALRLGLPVVTWPQPRPKFLADGRNVCMAGDRSALAMAAVLESLLRNPERAEALARGALASSERLDWPVIKLRWYEALIGSPVPGSPAVSRSDVGCKGEADA